MLSLSIGIPMFAGTSSTFFFSKKFNHTIDDEVRNYYESSETINILYKRNLYIYYVKILGGHRRTNGMIFVSNPNPPSSRLSPHHTMKTLGQWGSQHDTHRYNGDALSHPYDFVRVELS